MRLISAGSLVRAQSGPPFHLWRLTQTPYNCRRSLRDGESFAAAAVGWRPRRLPRNLMTQISRVVHRFSFLIPSFARAVFSPSGSALMTASYHFLAAPLSPIFEQM